MKAKFIRWRWLLVLLLAGVGGAAQAAPKFRVQTDFPSHRPGVRFDFKDDDRVLFMGDSFFQREGNLGCLEAWLTAHFYSNRITFRNLSWSADTPLGKSRASFDWNKSPDDWLGRVKEQVALVKPTVAFLAYGLAASFEGEAGRKDFHRDLLRLMDAINEVSGGGVRFILVGPIACEALPSLPDDVVDRNNRNLQGYSTEMLVVAQERSQWFIPLLYTTGAKSATDPQWTEDGLHLTAEGYVMLAAHLQWGLGHKTLVQYHRSPDFEPLRRAVVRKNRLFFDRWRPQNWTYLFGFRKNEQGRNAVEIPKFDPLIAEWDTRINTLRTRSQASTNLVAELMSPAKPEQRDSNFREQPVPTFTVADGFEVRLWAENPMLYKPIQMNWDPQGRLWVASSRMYPQVRPGQEREDAIIVLEDADGDGHADKSTVFADGLMIPTGVLPDGRGGGYVAASHELLHFADTNGDGVADTNRVVLDSFGTEDTHHNLHTLRWGYDGHIYLNQSIYTHSHLETPYGVRRLNSAGIWRFNPDTWQLDVFTRGGCNPWGHHWDQYGNSFFTDGAGFKGVYHALEGATYFTYSDMRREADSISPGNYPKFASLEVVHSPNFPADWQGSLITCDFRAHRVVRFGLKEVGSTFQTQELPDLLRSTNVTFRPIDVRFGPDGALYVADWSNPIIQHGEVDFRDPRRDHEHGRIWRVAAKAPLAKPDRLRSLATWAGPKLRGVASSPALLNVQAQSQAEAPLIAELLDLTLSPSGWEQEQARVLLRQLGARATLPVLEVWLAKQADPRARLEAVWLREAFARPVDDLLGGLVTAQDERLRMAAARQLAR